MADLESEYCRIGRNGFDIQPADSTRFHRISSALFGSACVLTCIMLVAHASAYSPGGSSGIDALNLISLPSSARITRKIMPQQSLEKSRRADVRMETVTKSESTSQSLTRRNAMATMGAAALSPLVPNVAKAAGEDNIDVYFGCGCFWHVQHEFVQAEKKYLNRGDLELTALTGYAGGNAGQRDGKVCYHNAGLISDYGSLGHAEVVKMSIPPSSFSDFAKEYVALFDKEGNRPDQFGDRGLEYRNLVGIPGGKDSPLAQELVKVSKANGDKLDFAVGKGDDPDKRALAFIMDSTKHPFYQAEVYHQFHDGFAMGENYPDSYNGLTSKLYKAGKIVNQGCPNGLIGLGIGGL